MQQATNKHAAVNEVFENFFFVFGATAPSGPWPPHSLGF